MRTITALEVRAKFGQVLDEAAAGERFIVERAGMAVAAIPWRTSRLRTPRSSAPAGSPRWTGSS